VKFEQRLTDRVLDLNAPKADGDIQKMLLEAVAEEALNNYGVRSNVDPKTLKNYLNKMDAKVVEKADVKNSSRSKAFKDIRTPMSLVGLQGQVSDQNLFSSDDISIYANDVDKPTVIATDRAIKLLRPREKWQLRQRNESKESSAKIQHV